MIPLYPFKNSKESIRLFSHYECTSGIFNLSFLVYDLKNQLLDFYPFSTGELLGKIYLQENLWQTTCFEIFFGNTNSPDYYELNFNSQGDWNLFYFTDYRQRKNESFDSVDLKIELEKLNSGYQLRFQFEIKQLAKLKLPCKVNLAAVVKTNSEISYWSQKHSSQKPDFHDAENFSLFLNEGNTNHG